MNNNTLGAVIIALLFCAFLVTMLSVIALPVLLIAFIVVMILLLSFA